MFFNLQLSKLIHRVTRKECSKIPTRQYFGAISTHRVSKNEAHKTQSGIPGQASKVFHGIPKINLLIPVRHNRKLTDNKQSLIDGLKNDLEFDGIPNCVLATWISAIISIEVVLDCMELTTIYAESFASTQIVLFACILSYIGGVHWGLTLSDNPPNKPNWTNLGNSIMPLLLAWSALLMPMNSAIAILILAHIGTFMKDKSMEGCPKWYLDLRLLITVFVVLGLIEIYIAKMIKEFQDKKKRIRDETACD